MPRKDQNEYNEYMRSKMAEYRRQRKEKINNKTVNLTEAVISGDMRGLTKPLLISSLQDIYKMREINEKSFDLFLGKPYTVMPKSEGEWYLIVPKFTNLEYGWLFQSDEVYNVFIINRYVSWLTPIPDDLKADINIKPPELDVKLDGTTAIYDPSKEDLFRRKFRGTVRKYIAPGKAEINKTSIFNVKSMLIREGILPFEPSPVNPNDLMNLETKVELRDYQEIAWKTFLEYGAIGIYWPPGAGKMFISLYALTKLNGRKLVVVPSLTLKEEWERKIKTYLPWERQREIEIMTYVSARKLLNSSKGFDLIIFDEAQHLPANSYGVLSNIEAKYRMGLSATPFREDGRTDLIFALTGYPVGLDWKIYLNSGIIHRPRATCYVVQNQDSKKSLTKKLVEEAKGKLIIFSDSLKLGKEIASNLGVPFVNGESKNRLQTISQNKTTVISRVGDEGLDITNLETVIEIDFLFGSRRQELQRFGRLLHSRYRGKYVIIMTKEEYVNYRKRLLSLFEKGFEVDVQEVSK